MVSRIDSVQLCPNIFTRCTVTIQADQLKYDNPGRSTQVMTKIFDCSQKYYFLPLWLIFVNCNFKLYLKRSV